MGWFEHGSTIIVFASRSFRALRRGPGGYDDPRRAAAYAGSGLSAFSGDGFDLRNPAVVAERFHHLLMVLCAGWTKFFPGTQDRAA